MVVNLYPPKGSVVLGKMIFDTWSSIRSRRLSLMLAQRP